MKNLNQLIEIYKRNHAVNEDWKLSEFKKKSKSIEELIKDAVLGLDPRLKRDRHQVRIPQKTLEEMIGKLQESAIVQELLKSKSFDDIFTIVYESKIKNFGSLAVYDTSLRLGVAFGYYPSVVYLHQGALLGAITLLGKNEVEKNSRYFCGDPEFPYIETEILPKPLCDMKPYHIENFLCINEENFKRLQKV